MRRRDIEHLGEIVHKAKAALENLNRIPENELVTKEAAIFFTERDFETLIVIYEALRVFE